MADSPKSDTLPDASMIAVMGPTGTGKSSFIRLVTDDQGINVGHGLESQTDEIRQSQYVEDDGRVVTFIDTPGFDDSREGVTDSDILKKIAFFLENEYVGKQRQLTGLIYMHRISDVRMGGISRRNLKMFQKLCGSDSLKNVIIVTTMWDTVDEVDGAAREDELKTKEAFFKPLLDEGATMRRHDDEFCSAYSIISDLLLMEPTTPQIVEELVNGTPFDKTAAGAELSAELQALIEKHQLEMKQIRADMMAAIKAKDDETTKILNEERKRLESESKRWKEDITKLQADLESMRREMRNDAENGQSSPVPEKESRSPIALKPPRYSSMDICIQLLELVHGSDLRLAPRELTVKICAYVQKYADAMAKSIQTAQDGSSRAEQVLEAGDNIELQQFVVEAQHTSVVTQDSFKTARQGIDTAVGDVNAAIFALNYQRKDKASTAKKWALLGTAASVTVIGAPLGAMMAGKAVYSGTRAAARTKTLKCLQSILELLGTLGGEMDAIVEWWTPVIEAFVGAKVAAMRPMQGNAVEARVEQLLSGLAQGFRSYAHVVEQSNDKLLKHLESLSPVGPAK